LRYYTTELEYIDHEGQWMDKLEEVDSELAVLCISSIADSEQASRIDWSPPRS
jgi:hypothetical protein